MASNNNNNNNKNTGASSLQLHNMESRQNKNRQGAFLGLPDLAMMEQSSQSPTSRTERHEEIIDILDEVLGLLADI